MAYFSKNKQTPQPLTPDEALAKIEHFCAYRERCPQEVHRKMTQLGVRADVAEQIYAVLESDGFVNETRFAQAFAGGKFRINRWGRVRIRLELQQRDISAGQIEAALHTIDELEYRQVLQELLEKKRQQYQDGNDPNARIKTAAALIRAGYEPELVFKYL